MVTASRGLPRMCSYFLDGRVLRRCRHFGGPCWFAAVVASGVIACAPAVRQAVSYSGNEYSRRAQPETLATVSSLPAGYAMMGRAQASCNAWREGSPVENRWLSDLDCSEVRLRGALRQKAASVGAELLVRERCGPFHGSMSFSRSNRAESRLVCRVGFARATTSARAREPLERPTAPGAAADPLAATPARARSLDDPTGEQAWRIRVNYRGSLPPESVAKQPLPADSVHEWSTVPASHRAVGTVQTECESACSVDAMRASVRVVAGRLGAADVAEVSCVPIGEGWSCVGRVAVPLDGHATEPWT